MFVTGFRFAARRRRRNLLQVTRRKRRKAAKRMKRYDAISIVFFAVLRNLHLQELGPDQASDLG
jgi:hypothetical protein